jgi:septal ring-binding cell division protein DamX
MPNTESPVQPPSGASGLEQPEMHQTEAGVRQKIATGQVGPNNTINLGQREGAERLVFDINAKIDTMDARLHDLGSLLDETQKQIHASLGEIRGREEGLSTRINEVASGLRISNIKQAKLTEELTQALHDANREVAQRINSLYASLDAQHEQVGILEAALPAVRTQISQLNQRLASSNELAQKRYRWLTAGIAAVALTAAGAISYMQFNPGAVPVAVQTRLSEATQSIVENAGAVADVAAAMGALESRLSATDSELEGLRAADAGTQTAIEQLGGKLDASLASFGTSMASAAAEIDDLKFRIEGPGNRGAGLTEPSLPVQGPAWLAAQNPVHYSIQLAGFYRYQYLVSYVNNNEQVMNDRPIAFDQARLGLRDWYNLFYGSYPTLEAAEAALAALPLRLQGNNPFVRSFASIQH